MTRKKTKTKNIHYWFMMGVASVLLAAPNATIIRTTVDTLDPFLFNTVRFSLIAVLTLPLLILHIRSLNVKNLRYAILVGFYMTLAVLGFVWAIKLSQASYVAIMTLITPISFILLSSKLTGERISRKAKLGITLAALGAFTIVALPIALAQDGEFIFYPAATMLSLLNSITFPLAIIYSKKANQAGLPLISVITISSTCIALICGLVVFSQSTPFDQLSEPNTLIAILYSSIAVALLARALNIASYEHIGSAISSALTYCETLLAIIIPIVILGETLSIEIVVGGILILAGVYIAEHRATKHHKHFHVLRHH